MRFEFYHEGLEETPKLSVDGTVPNSIHFSHWKENQTPAEVKADTSTEIALNLVASPNRRALTRGIELVTNNHFDTDGVLSVWTMITGERALDLRDALVAAAETGDFSEYTNERAIRVSILIQGGEQPFPNEGVNSPLARHLAGGTVADDARAYQLILPEVERALTRTDDYEPLWREGWESVERALESFASGSSRVAEDSEAQFSTITLGTDLYGPRGFQPARHAAPFIAISRHARGSLYLIAIPMTGGWSYRIDYPYYSWAETVERPRVTRRDLTPLVARLNELEKSAATGARGVWKADASELTSAIKFVDASGTLCPSSLTPDNVAENLRASLLTLRRAPETSFAGR